MASLDYLDGYNSNQYESFCYLEDNLDPKIAKNTTKVDFDDYIIEYFMYSSVQLEYLANYIYPFWRDQFITKLIKDNEQNKLDAYNPYSTWSNTDLARHNMGLKDNTLCFQMVMCDVPVGFCSLLLLDMFDREDKNSPFSNEVYKNSIIFYNFVIEKGFRGDGYGKKFLNYIIEYVNAKLKNTSEDYKYIILYVDKDNDIAKKIYEKVGFTIIGDNPADKNQDLYKYNMNLV
jgi:ribosomal protein S18 acetylase RimI-like enzyme